MPQWLKIMLLAVGLLIVVAFGAEPVLLASQRRRQPGCGRAGQARQPGPAVAMRAGSRSGPPRPRRRPVSSSPTMTGSS